MSRPIIFAPAILARAKAEINQYTITPQGVTGNVAMIGIARLKWAHVNASTGEVLDGQYRKRKPGELWIRAADPERSYTVLAELDVRDDLGPLFVPTACSCMDAECRKHRCKHVAIVSLSMGLPCAAGEITEEFEHI